jgi:hypothetical protein
VVSTETFTATPATTLTQNQMCYIVHAESGNAICAATLDSNNYLYAHALELGNTNYQWQINMQYEESGIRNLHL